MRSVECACGRKVELEDSWLNTCWCGQDFNGLGQALAPRHMWGEETGEHPADLVGPFDPDSVFDEGHLQGGGIW